jgi:hypothetical protein
MNRFLVGLARRTRAVFSAEHCNKRRLPLPRQRIVHQRGLKLEPLESRTLLSASWDEPKGATIYVDDTDRTKSFALKNGVSILGGYAGCFGSHL